MKHGLRRQVALVAALLTMSAVLAGSATAADTFVGTGNCILANGGHVERPAGSTIVIRNGYQTKNYGLLNVWLGAQTTTLSVNGGAPVDVSNLYGAPTQLSNGLWLASETYPTGVTLANPGDTLTFRITISVSHRIADVTNGIEGYDPGKPLFGGPGVIWDATCTVTAV
jgi:hypothetical protein